MMNTNDPLVFKPCYEPDELPEQNVTDSTPLVVAELEDREYDIAREVTVPASKVIGW